ncbi:MAG: thiamine phosphate synthase [Pseudomonadota bacterium]|nr:thiamine phosphate synthase [Pseudomonadota bacterium]
MTTQSKLRGLYIITDPVLTPPDVLLDGVARAIDGGARLVQYRNKAARDGRVLPLVRELAALCRSHSVPLIVNDDVELARDAQADGVHLGRDDTGITEARRVLGTDAIIGVSCYDRLDLALRANASGASYVAFGRFFPSRTKPDTVHAEPDLLTRARHRIDLPICAIGGIDADNAGTLVEAGADMVAIVGGVFAQPNVKTAAARIARQFL